MQKEPIAIIGLGCRLPGGNNPQEFWQILCNGVDAITEVPKSRWDLEAYYDPDPSQPHKMTTKWGGFLDQVDQFDPLFFGIAPREVNSMDPQQRLILETTWEALEDAGQIPKQLSGSKTGVFVGVSSHDYSSLVVSDDPYSLTGNTNCIVPNRISYIFNFKGPSLAIDTACSSSLVAVHLACQSLWSGESTLAIAGGVQVLLSADLTVSFSKAGLLAPDGRCKTFDAKANGYVRSEGAGAVVLKPLSQAQQDGDPIYAVILGSAVNQDGRSNGLSAPNPDAQEEVVRTAYAQAGVSPGRVQYVEAHGTGTKIGDPLELKALGAALGEQRPVEDVCKVGSVKTNVGHSETAAGITGLIKVALALKHQQIPPSLHFQEPNPYIDFKTLPLRVQQTLEPWPVSGEAALAGVNSFGFGGTNAHVVLQEAPPPTTPLSFAIAKRPLHLLTLSAKSAPALKALAARYHELLAQQPLVNIADLCYTANTRRSHFPHRLVFLGESVSELHTHIGHWLSGETDSPYFCQGQVASKNAPRVTFLFTGQGSQYAGMGQELYQTQPLVRRILDRCNEILQPYLQPSLLDVLFSETEDQSLLDETVYTQPALFALEYALAQLWMSWGIKPAVVLGHSVGEYVAACIAGVFSLEDGLKLIATRGRLMQALPQNGAMVAVLADEATLQYTLNGNGVAIAAINGPHNFVLSGTKEAIAQITAKLEAQAVKTKPLTVSHAFHSPLMEPMLSEFAQVASEVTYARPQISLISNLTGAPIGAEIATPEYWCLHVRQPVKFAASVQTLNRQGERVFLEVGPQPVLLGMGRNCLTDADCQWLPSLRPQQSDWQQLLHSLGQLYRQGVPVNWDGFDEDYPRKLVSLPTYPFQRQRYWWTEADFAWTHNHQALSGDTSATQHPLLGQRITPIEAQDQIWFESKLDSPTLHYLLDHQVLEQAVMPATVYIALAIAAGEVLKENSQTVGLEAISLEQPLHLKQYEQPVLQLQLQPHAQNGYTFEVFSRDAAASDETLCRHATGSLRLTTPVQPASTRSLEQIQEACPQVKSVGYHFRQLALRGLHYGPAFQGIQKLWAGPDQALGLVCLPTDITSDRSAYPLHPALLDACFQVFASAIEEFPVVYLPIGVEQVTIYHSAPTEVWSHVQTRSHQQSHLSADVCLYDAAGNLVAEIRGLSLRSVTHPTLRRIFHQPLDLSTWLYQTTWQRQDREENALPKPAEPRCWLVLAADSESWQALKQQLEAQGDRPIWVQPGQNYRAIGSDSYEIAPDSLTDFQTLLQELVESNPLPLCGVLHLWGIGASSLAELDLEAKQRNICGSVLYLLQALAQQPTIKPRLWLVTAGAQVIGGTAPHQQTADQVMQSTLWGLGRAIALEYPELSCTRLDLDPTVNVDAAVDAAVMADLYMPTAEDQIAYRQGHRYVERLDRYAPLERTDWLQRPDAPAFQLKIADYGILDRLTLAPARRQIPGSGEVEIEVCAAGLNFRDVLNALGMLRDYLAEMGFTDASDVPFGGECAGKVVAVGAGVTEFQVGDAVIGVNAIGSLAQFVTTPAQFVIPKPEGLNFAEAATVSTAFLTAQYALQELAQIKAGDRILIHSAAGGVGQAAVQIAQRAGAEIYATASPGKWAVLEAMGIEHIFNSRTLDFAPEIAARTEGQGVDIVLNCFNGDFIPKSLETLAPGGRFIEIGKIGIWSAAQIHEQRPDVTYAAFDLLERFQAAPHEIVGILQGLMPAFQGQELRPLPHQTFPIEAAVSAFRHMAQAKHVGKVVLTFSEATDTQQPTVSDAGTYLITGGLGALGLQVAQWLVEQGAKQLVLLGRRVPSDISQETIEHLEKQGAQVLTAQADVAQLDELRSVFERIQTSLPPLRGIFHTAGILQDGILQQQTWENFEQVMAPKVRGTWNLHQLSQNLSLDFFVCFSSIAALLGSPGQGNYAAANAYMDALTTYRRQLGLPGLSINWGPWDGAGMAGQLSDRDRERIAATGVSTISPNQGIQALEQLLLQESSEIAQIGVLKIQWAQFCQQFLRTPPLLERVNTVSVSQPSSAFLQQLEQTPAAAQLELLSHHVRLQVAKVLGLSSPDLVEPERSFTELGMDSLMGMELKSRLQNSLNANFPATLAIDYPTVGSLIHYFAGEFLALEATAPATDAPAPLPGVTEQVESDRWESSPTLQDRDVPEMAVVASQPNNGPTTFAPSPAPETTSEIPPEFYDFTLSPEYLNLQQYIEQGKEIGNPFFTVHDGIAKDTTSIGNQTQINFASYNYLGFSGDPDISAAAKAAIDRYGTSVSASRIVSGERPIHQELEQAIASFLGTEDCIAYIGGHTTNVSTIGHLFGKNDLIVCDAFSHNSIQLGCELSGSTVMPFPHNDVEKLAEILAEHRSKYEKTLIVIEGVYSADGDLPPLLPILALKKRYKAFLMVDEAHSMGVIGANGRGVAEHFDINPRDVDLWMGTLSKSLASCGGYIAASKAIVQYLKYSSPGFIFSVGMTPPNAAAALAALQKLQAEPERVAQLHQRTALFFELAQSHGLNTGISSGSPIVPVIIGDPYRAVRLSRAMMQRGINVQPMLFPSVPYDAARLRFFLSCTHTEAQIRETITVLAEEMEKLDQKPTDNWLHYWIRTQMVAAKVAQRS